MNEYKLKESELIINEKFRLLKEIPPVFLVTFLHMFKQDFLTVKTVVKFAQNLLLDFSTILTVNVF